MIFISLQIKLNTMMKRLLLIFLLPFFFLCGCKKDEVPEVPIQSILKFNSNGVNIQCSSNIKGSLNSSTDSNYLKISGAWTDGSVEFSLFSDQAIAPGVYSFEGVNDHGDEVRDRPRARPDRGGGARADERRDRS